MIVWQGPRRDRLTITRTIVEHGIGVRGTRKFVYRSLFRNPSHSLAGSFDKRPLSTLLCFIAFLTSRPLFPDVRVALDVGVC